MNFLIDVLLILAIAFVIVLILFGLVFIYELIHISRKYSKKTDELDNDFDEFKKNIMDSIENKKMMNSYQKNE